MNALGFKEDLTNAPWAICESFDNIDDNYTTWKTLFLETCDKHAPKRNIKVRKFYFPNGKVLKLAKRHNSESMWNEYKKLRNEVTAEIRKAKSEYFTELTNNATDTKTYWKILKMQTAQPTLTDEKAIANTLSQHFATVGERLTK